VEAYKKDRNGNPIMRESFVVFLDVLGFKDLVLDAESHDEVDGLLKKFYHAVSKNLSIIKPKEGMDRHKVRTFTDNVLISWPVREEGEIEYSSLIYSASEFQLKLLLEGFFVRGGAVKGPIYVDEEFIFGPALIKAYQLESKKAKYPRIVLSEEVLKKVMDYSKHYGDKRKSPFNFELLIDKDSEIFINYLELCLTGALLGHTEIQLRILTKHKELIERQLERYRYDVPVLEKYQWLANYHNFVLSQLIEGNLFDMDIEHLHINEITLGYELKRIRK